MFRVFAAAFCLAGTAALADDAPAKSIAAPTHRVPHLELRLLIREGRVSVEGLLRGEHVESSERPHRRFDQRGRYTARLLYEGKPVGDSVRFDFPLLGAADAGEARALDLQLRAHVTARASVRLPVPPADEGAEIVISDDRGAELRVPVSAARPSPPAAKPRRGR